MVRDFAEYFHRSPDKLGPEHIRQYQAYLFQTKKLTPATVSQCVSALRFLFVKTLYRHFVAEHIPFPKCRKRLPTVLSPEEVRKLVLSQSDHPPRLSAPVSSTAKPAIFRCPKCATPTIVAEKVSALTIWQLTLRSPPIDSS